MVYKLMLKLRLKYTSLCGLKYHEVLVNINSPMYFLRRSCFKCIIEKIIIIFSCLLSVY